MTPREAVVAAAAAEVGKRDATPYWVASLGSGWQGPYPRHWCGAFCLWALKQAGLAQGVLWRVRVGFVYRLKITRNPKPGDIAYFAAKQHHALVESVTDTTVTTIDGNQPDVRRKADRSRRSVTAFYSIESLLPKEPEP